MKPYYTEMSPIYAIISSIFNATSIVCGVVLFVVVYDGFDNMSMFSLYVTIMLNIIFCMMMIVYELIVYLNPGTAWEHLDILGYVKMLICFIWTLLFIMSLDKRITAVLLTIIMITVSTIISSVLIGCIRPKNIAEPEIAQVETP